LCPLALAVAFLTRLPVPQRCLSEAPGALAQALAWAPLVGVLVAILAALPALLLSALGATPMLAALVAVVSIVYLTRGLHEDGLADFADALGGGWTPQRRLEIMKDSHIGSFGALALILSVGLRVAALAALIERGAIPFVGALLAAAALSRAALPAMLFSLPPAREHGLSHGAGRSDRRAVAIAATIAGGLTLAICPWPNAWLALVGAIGGFAIVRTIAAAALGGQTGDVAGAAQQSIEIIVLIALGLALAS